MWLTITLHAYATVIGHVTMCTALSCIHVGALPRTNRLFIIHLKLQGNSVVAVCKYKIDSLHDSVQFTLVLRTYMCTHMYAQLSIQSSSGTYCTKSTIVKTT